MTTDPSSGDEVSVDVDKVLHILSITIKRGLVLLLYIFMFQ